jgi:hypothetical protein
MQLYKKKKRKTKDKVVSKVGEVKLSLQSVGLWLLMMECVCMCVYVVFFCEVTIKITRRVKLQGERRLKVSQNESEN